MASMTDMIFLLLIFFMVTSTLVSPNAIKVSLPKSGSQATTGKTLTVSINADLKFFIEGREINPASLENELQLALRGKTEPVIKLEADKSVAIEHMVRVMNTANKMQAKVVLATEAE